MSVDDQLLTYKKRLEGAIETGVGVEEATSQLEKAIEERKNLNNIQELKDLIHTGNQVIKSSIEDSQNKQTDKIVSRYEALESSVLKEIKESVSQLIPVLEKLPDGFKIDLPETNIDGQSVVVSNIGDLEVKLSEISKKLNTAPEVKVENKQDLTHVNKTFDHIVKLLEKIKDKKTEVLINKELDFPRDPRDAIPVVLVDSERRKFYDAVMNVIGGGGFPNRLTRGDSVKVVSGDTPINVDLATIDEGNSTTEPLGANETFTGQAVESGSYSGVIVLLSSDAPSAAGGIQFQTSTDGTNWDHIHTYSKKELVDRHYEETLAGKYFRMVYVNGDTPQTHFRLQTKLIKSAPVPHVHRIDEPINDDHPASINRSIITGKEIATDDYENLTVVRSENSGGVYFSLPVVGGARPSEIPGRNRIRKHIANATADALVHEVTEGTTFYLTDILIFSTNTANATAVAYIRDGTTVAGDIIMPFRVESAQGPETKMTTVTHSFTEPLRFLDGVFYDQVNNLTTSITITGYEE
jgi:hypothetical protein